MERIINISEYDYALPDERIAKFPLEQRDSSKLLQCNEQGEICTFRFSELPTLLPEGAVMVFNNTKVIRARLIFFKTTGARIEIFCLEPHEPADYERSLAAEKSVTWKCIIGNLKKWKNEPLTMRFAIDGAEYELSATLESSSEKEHIVRFDWNAPVTFGQLLEHLGKIPIPPYLNRDSAEVDNTRYQTVYCRWEGSVAAPTAGLHFTPEVLETLSTRGIARHEVTLHVGAGTFVPVKVENAAEHTMHTEHFEVDLSTLDALIEAPKRVAVGTTSVRTLESLPVLGYRILSSGTPDLERPVAQWEAYDIPEHIEGAELLTALRDYMRNNNIERLAAATQIMITPAGFKFRVVDIIVTNFHQPHSTLLLLIASFVGKDWRKIYNYALDNDFRFLSYGDSSLLFRDSLK
ncbi:MAG: S-adenosylmethionine:tRNA ribosyltransferase-isomerase [Rikenellaceae bacterium]|nr:S-adenosylmethionine:tRNA ribosyltransferase-isomerase [Rikenellaceae bacterium]